MSALAKAESYFRSLPTVFVLDLEFVKTLDGTNYYNCPFGHGHLAYNPPLGAGRSEFLTCAICGKQAFLDIRKGELIKSTLANEESAFRKLLSRFADLPDFIPAQKAFRLWNEQGCPLEILEERTDWGELQALVNAHKLTGKANRMGDRVYQEAK